MGEIVDCLREARQSAQLAHYPRAHTFALIAIAERLDRLIEIQGVSYGRS